MNLSAVYNRASKLVSDNSPAILTGIGVVGTLTTAYLAGKASWRASEIVADETVAAQITTGDENFEFTNKAKAKMVWKLYIPSLASAAVTSSAIICASRIGTKRTAAMAAAFAVTERAYDEYTEKVKEHLGKPKEKKVRDEIAQDRVNRSYEENREVIITGNGDVLCHDAYSGRYFMSNMEAIRRAENDINAKILREDSASLTDFYNALKIEPTSSSDDVGWNTDKRLELHIATVLTSDNRPCISVDFAAVPLRDYWRYV